VPIRLRLTLITTVLMAVILSLVCWVLFWRFTTAVNYTFSKGLRSRAQAIVAALERDESPLGGEGDLIETDESFAQILTRNGRVLDSTAGIDPAPLLTPVESAQCDDCIYWVEKEIRTTEEGTPLTPALLLGVAAPGQRIVVVGASTEDEQETIAELTRGIVVGGSAALLASSLAGWVVAGFALRPVERMRREAEAISADDSKQLALPQTRDELERLGGTLNAMIGRMRGAVERERRFVDDASHELRTPLSVLRAEIEVSLRRARTSDELEATLRSAAEETERLQSLAEDLLLLARSDRGQLPIRREAVNVSDALASALERHTALANERSVTITRAVEPGIVANLDGARLRQAVDNLVSNGVRHSPHSGAVRVTASARDGSVEIVVEDEGQGFEPSFLPKAFDPFARSDHGRTRDDGGTGLGLAIVRAIALAHGGSVEASNRPEGGARVVLRLPL
jgi:two-component system OmpR family sensor kinase